MRCGDGLRQHPPLWQRGLEGAEPPRRQGGVRRGVVVRLIALMRCARVRPSVGAPR